MPIVYLGKEYEEPLPLSYCGEADLPIKASKARGSSSRRRTRRARFVGFSFELVEAIVPANGDVVAKAKEILAKGDAFIIADLEPRT